jgi:molecular chaperone HscB
MDFKKNYFELFGVDASFTVDLKVISEKFLDLQRKSHPDKFTSESAAEQRLAVQYSSHVNTANRTLKSPLLRAEYLLELSAYPLNGESMTIDDSQFLMAQMECRESLAELVGKVNAESVEVLVATEALEVFSAQTHLERTGLLDTFALAYTSQQFLDAQQAIAKLHFVEKMLLEIERIEDNLLG